MIAAIARRAPLLLCAAVLCSLPCRLGAQDQRIDLDLARDASTAVRFSPDKSTMRLGAAGIAIRLHHLPAADSAVSMKLTWGSSASAVLGDAYLRGLAPDGAGARTVNVDARGQFDTPDGIVALAPPFAIVVTVHGKAFAHNADLVGIGQAGASPGTNAPKAGGDNGGECADADAGEGFLRQRYGGVIARPYRGNRVNLFFNADGRQVGRMPRNVDQDDEFIIRLVVRVDQQRRYDIKVEEGDYAPSDLSIRPAAPIDSAAVARGARCRPDWTILTFEMGPYTTSDFRFTITYADSSADSLRNLKTYSVHINPLYHVGLGVSLIRTDLAVPRFEVLPRASGDTINTIRALDTGDRSMVTLNAIWYWRVFHRDFWSGDGLTRGRDVLKEADVKDRIFPTAGISIDRKLSDNLFFGVVFEFARGGSLILGRHYGKSRVLADPGFVPGTTSFAGTSADVKTSVDWRTEWFGGVTLDTRVLNSLFGLIGGGAAPRS